MTAGAERVQARPVLLTNTDTGLLKCIALAAMLVDHIGAVYFPLVRELRWVGRLAFPLFCYCMVVGFLYTRCIQKYVLRVGLMAVIAQPFWLLAFYPDDILGNLTAWNTVFTLFISLLGLWAVHAGGWRVLLLLPCVLVLHWLDFDYNTLGLLLMLTFYFLRTRPRLLWLVVPLWYVQFAFFSPIGYLGFTVAGHYVNCETLQLFALPLVVLNTHTGLRPPKWLFYVFYPAHFALLAALRPLVLHFM